MLLKGVFCDYGPNPSDFKEFKMSKTKLAVLGICQICLQLLVVRIGIAQEPHSPTDSADSTEQVTTETGTPPNPAIDNSPILLDTFHLANPLEALAGELIDERGLSPEDFADAKRQLVVKAKDLFKKTQFLHMLKYYNLNNSQELSQKLEERGTSLSAIEDRFVWKVFIQELKRQ